MAKLKSGRPSLVAHLRDTVELTFEQIDHDSPNYHPGKHDVKAFETINGRVVFLDKKSPLVPKPGDRCRAYVSGQNRQRTVYFVKVFRPRTVQVNQ